jgi:hypothetical protein
MKNYKVLKVDCCYTCNWSELFDDVKGYDWCKHPDAKKIMNNLTGSGEIEPIGICDNFDDEIRGN